MSKGSHRVIKGLYLLFAVFSALVFYALLQVMRTTFRLLSVNDYYDLCTLTPEEIYFSNFIFAGFAYLMGQDMILRLWFIRPGAFKQRFRSTNHVAVQIDRQYPLYHFFMWLGKFALIYLFYFMMEGQYLNETLLILPDYGAYFIIAIVVFFFISWNTIRRKFRKESFKLQVGSLALLFAFSFGMATIHFVNDDYINQKVTELNPIETFGFEFPRMTLPCNGYQTDLPVLLWKETSTNKWYVFDNTVRGPLQSKANCTLIDGMVNRHSQYDEMSIAFDRRLSMEEVQSLMKCLKEKEIVRIEFGVLEELGEQHQSYQVCHVYANIADFEFSYGQETTDTSYPRENITTASNNHFNMGGVLYGSAELSSAMFEKMKTNDSLMFQYKWNDSAVFEHYIQLRHIFNTAKNDYLNDLSYQNYGRFYEELSYPEEMYLLDKTKFAFRAIPQDEK